MSGIIHKIEEKLHGGGDHKKEENHQKADVKHTMHEGEKHEGNMVEKMKEKITHEGGEEHGEKKKKENKKKKKKEGEHHGDSSSSSDSD